MEQDYETLIKERVEKAQSNDNDGGEYTFARAMCGGAFGAECFEKAAGEYSSVQNISSGSGDGCY